MAKAELAKFPFEGYRLYIVLHKQMNRRMANLVHIENGTRTTISLARYLMSVHLGRILGKDEHVDHINNNKLDDRIENLQILSPLENLKKRAMDVPKQYLTFTCPVCGNEFRREKRQAYKATKLGRVITCSKRCGGIRGKLPRSCSSVVEQSPL